MYFVGFKVLASCDVSILLVLQWVAKYDIVISLVLDMSVTKNHGNRRSAEWKYMYFHWFGACHVRILLVLEGSVTNNHLNCKVSVWKCMYFL